MGGCCCCASKGVELSSPPAYYYYPRALDEHVPLSSHCGASALSTGLLVDTNLDTSVPDAYRPPPAPIPFDAGVGHPPSLQETREPCSDKDDGMMQTTNSGSVQEPAGFSAREPSAKGEDAKESDCKEQTNLEVDLEKEPEVELSKPVESLILGPEEEDVCPVCLEGNALVVTRRPFSPLHAEYDKENPKITTKCEHHFHLACILEWMERSDTCPVCDKEMIIDLTID